MSGHLRLYRRDGEPGMCCAVSADEPLPAFIDTGHWLLDTKLLNPEFPPAGFDPRAATDALRSMGFYMFYRLAEPEPRRPGRDGGSRTDSRLGRR